MPVKHYWSWNTWWQRHGGLVDCRWNSRSCCSGSWSWCSPWRCPNREGMDQSLHKLCILQVWSPRHRQTDQSVTSRRCDLLPTQCTWWTLAGFQRHQLRRLCIRSAWKGRGLKNTIIVIIYWRLIAPPSAPGHLRAFHNFKYCTWMSKHNKHLTNTVNIKHLMKPENIST